MRVEDFLICEDASIMDALRQLDATAKKCIFAIDSKRRLVGSLTDGDARRLILRQGGLEGVVRDAMNRNLKTATISDGITPARVSTEFGVQAVPIVDSEGMVSEIVFGDLSILTEARRLEDPLPVVMMAGGKGTRLLPYTAILPKPLIPIGEKTIAERIVERFYEGGCDDFWLVLNYKRGMIKAYFDELNPPYSVHYIDEDRYCGTGGGLKLAEGMVNSTFVFTNCDILVDINLVSLLKTHRQANNAVTIVTSIKDYTVPYGTIEIEEGGGIAAMVEKPTFSSLINTGLYLVEPEVLDYIEAGEAIGFPDVIERCRNAGLKIGVFPVSEGAWLDMGQPEELSRMMSALGE